MKLKWCVLVFLIVATMAQAQTNNLTTLLQQGLLEEQANRDLDAAIADYKNLATQFDKDRQLAATAIFRLGECYRAQGKTNEAAVQYQRILRDFSDQQTLATLSRQDLAGMGVSFQERSAANAKGLSSKSISAADDEDREIARIQKMMENSPDLINAVDPRNAVGTPLIQAAFYGQLKVAAYLLDHGADVNGWAPNVVQTGELQAAGRVTPLMAAVIAGNKTMVQLLIDRKADINCKDQHGNTPLHLAVRMKFQSVTELLLANHANVNATNENGISPLFNAVQNGQVKMVQMLVASGADVNIEDKNGFTALNYAIKTSPEMVSALLSAGLNPNTEDSLGRTPLSYATEKDPDIVPLLLNAKADPNAGSFDAPLLYAICGRNLSVAELLLKSGANPNAKGKVEWQSFSWNFNYENGRGLGWADPLWLAVTMNQPAMVKLLLKFKADPDDAQIGNRAVIFDSLSKPEILSALLDAGAKTEVQDASDLTSSRLALGIAMPSQREWNLRTPLLVAADTESNVLAIAALLAHGADANARDPQGNTALHWAAFNLADEKAFSIMLEHHADPNVRNNDGKTPLDVVKENQKHPVSRGRFPWRNSNGMIFQEASPEQKACAEKLIALLHQYGALDNLPDWNRITVGRSNSDIRLIEVKGTNNWNRFTLFEFAFSWCRFNQTSFPDFSHVSVTRPNADGKIKRIDLSLLNSTNGIDGTKDMPLFFGDVVEIPERPHTLAEKDELIGTWERQLKEHLERTAGTAKLIVDGGKTINVPLKDYVYDCRIGTVLGSQAVRAVIASFSDLTQVKIRRSDSKTGAKPEWTLDCSQAMQNNNSAGVPNLRLRDGDVIEVPVKP